MSLAELPLLPGLLFLLLSEPPIPPSPPVMFRGDPAHTGVAAGALFNGQGGYVDLDLTAEGTWRLEPQH